MGRQPVNPRGLHLRRARLAMVLGLKVPDSDVARILDALGLTAAATAVIAAWRVGATNDAG